MFKMFAQFGFDITEQDLKKLFQIISRSSAGRMTLDEFEQFMLNDQAKTCINNTHNASLQGLGR